MPIIQPIMGGQISSIKISFEPPVRYREFHYVGGPYDGKTFLKPIDVYRDTVKVPVRVPPTVALGQVPSYELQRHNEHTYQRHDEGNRIIMKEISFIQYVEYW